MNWPDATLLGALGGAVVQLIAVWSSLTDWQTNRRDFMAVGRKPLPSLTRYVDLPAETLVALTRVSLGAVAGLMFHSQVTGVTAAIAVGASGPALLARIGGARVSTDIKTEECPDIVLSGTDHAVSQSE